MTRAPRRGSGSVRQLKSGRYEVRYTGPDGKRRNLPGTFPTKKAAEAALAKSLSERIDNKWIAPELNSVTFESWFTPWLKRHCEDLQPQTVELYEGIARHFILGAVGGIRLGDVALGRITPSLVAEWRSAVKRTVHAHVVERDGNAAYRKAYAEVIRCARATAPRGSKASAAHGAEPSARSAGEAARRAAQANVRADAGHTRTAHAYKLLKTAFMAAIREGRVHSNPCNIPGADAIRTPERPIASVQEAERAADAAPDRFRAAVHLKLWSALRGGELFALQRRHVDLEEGTVRVEQALQETKGKGVTVKPMPKSHAGFRTVKLPPSTVRILQEHLERYVGEDLDAFVFVGAKGGLMARSRRAELWGKVRAEIGRQDLHMHDLRHTSGTVTAALGTPLKQSMKRLGHSSARAALRYQHATEQGDAEIAEKMQAMLDGRVDVLSLRRARKAAS
ncbi:tyrosine-type recombinase/integrase [Streptomyces sp. NPDC051684]|uniref:tyrosine-type recombinase/integrase n=1 Tax=Streptomyces sp. NPDC051684 TaxID=3365670 RepID=UPI0037B6C5CC